MPSVAFASPSCYSRQSSTGCTDIGGKEAMLEEAFLSPRFSSLVSWCCSNPSSVPYQGVGSSVVHRLPRRDEKDRECDKSLQRYIIHVLYRVTFLVEVSSRINCVRYIRIFGQTTISLLAWLQYLIGIRF